MVFFTQQPDRTKTLARLKPSEAQHPNGCWEEPCRAPELPLGRHPGYQSLARLPVTVSKREREVWLSEVIRKSREMIKKSREIPETLWLSSCHKRWGARLRGDAETFILCIWRELRGISLSGWQTWPVTLQTTTLSSSCCEFVPFRSNAGALSPLLHSLFWWLFFLGQ